MRSDSRGVFGWVMYDWAVSAFSTTVTAGFFPIFFADYWSDGAESTVTTFWLGVAVSGASLAAALLAPVLGAMADLGAARKRSLAAFAGIGICATAALYLIPAGAWEIAAGVYMLATVGFLASNVFYDSLLMSVSTEANVDIVSARGYGLGYIGGGLLFLINVLMVQFPGTFGFSDTAQAVRYSFLSVAVWWSLFSIPLYLFVPEERAENTLTIGKAFGEGYRRVVVTFREIRQYKVVLLFLFAYWFYIDGVDTIVTMAVAFGRSIGYSTQEMITALLLVQFVAFPFAYLLGWLGQRFGPKRIILLCIGVYGLITVLGSRMSLEPYRLFGMEIHQFYTLAILLAMVQGGIQALSRSLYARLIPREKSAEFFGFYNMLGRFAAIVGPVLMGTVGRLTGSPGIGIQSIAILFVAGGVLLWKVTVPRRSSSMQ